ncbi:hypothetical protein niasHT_034761 [Heterodera trifolii]|uniref:Uncharacterized protein n=1 Tax=Heterodera trifolii TaxID=157864 RepID=A0ABD2I2U9_9BILA
MTNQLQERKKLLNAEIEQLQKELNEIEADNAEKQKQLSDEQNSLTEVRTEEGIQQHKLRQLKESLECHEKALEESNAEFDKKKSELLTSVQTFSKAASKRNDKFKMALQILGRVTIKDEDRYGNMEDFKQKMRKQIDEFKSEIALGHQEIENKRKELEQLKAKFNAEIDVPEIGPELKREICDNCNEALKCQRKRLVDLKMLNHDMKFKLESTQKN